MLIESEKKVLRNCYVDQMAHKVGGFSHFMCEFPQIFHLMTNIE
jgi:hypothetical protein